MGLDMYLTRNLYIGGNYEHRNVTGTIDLVIDKEKLIVDVKEVREIILHVGYWRKANQIHKWFVDNVQDGTDNCEEHYVSYTQLMKLKSLCEQAIENEDPTLLPPTSGFFFGGTEIDEYYWDGLKRTIKILEKVTKGGDYYYRSSW